MIFTKGSKKAYLSFREVPIHFTAKEQGGWGSQDGLRDANTLQWPQQPQLPGPAQQQQKGWETIHSERAFLQWWSILIYCHLWGITPKIATKHLPVVLLLFLFAWLLFFFKKKNNNIVLQNLLNNQLNNKFPMVLIYLFMCLWDDKEQVPVWGKEKMFLYITNQM